MGDVRDKRFELHALHDKQVIKVPTSPKDRKLFLGRSHIPGQPKEVPKVAVLLAESRSGTIRLMVNSKKPVVVHLHGEEHVLNQGDECHFRHGDSVELVQGLPYHYRLVYEDRSEQKKVRKGIKPAPEEIVVREPTVGVLAFPSISTGSFKFDLEKAVPVALDVIEKFLKDHPQPEIRLLLVDSIKVSPTLKLFQEKWKERHGDPRFSTLHGNLVRLGSNCDVCAQFIVDPANIGFNVVSGLNRFIHIAAAPHLLPDTQQLHDGDTDVGQTYPVRVSHGCPLYNEGVRYVLHVIGPNMNPCWPECLRDDYEKGCELLKQSYQTMLDTYYKIAFDGLELPDLHPAPVEVAEAAEENEATEEAEATETPETAKRKASEEEDVNGPKEENHATDEVSVQPPAKKRKRKKSSA